MVNIGSRSEISRDLDGARSAQNHPGTVRAIWESLDRRQAALNQGLAYTRLANPISEALAERRASAGKSPHRLR